MTLRVGLYGCGVGSATKAVPFRRRKAGGADGSPPPPQIGIIANAHRTTDRPPPEADQNPHPTNLMAGYI